MMILPITIIAIVLCNERHKNISNNEITSTYRKLIDDEYKAELREKVDAWKNDMSNHVVWSSISNLILQLEKISDDKKKEIEEDLICFAIDKKKKNDFILYTDDMSLSQKLKDVIDVEFSKYGKMTLTLIEYEQKDVYDEVDVPGELIPNGIRYQQLNGKHLLFHKEKRLIKKEVGKKKFISFYIL